MLAVQAIEDWCKSVHSQKCKHLWQFLALKKSGVSTSSWTNHPEATDFEFCDRYLRVRDTDSPYYDPLDRSFRIASHPHSNLATARKNTFKNRWKAAETRSDDSDEWRFASDYLEKFKSNACSVGGVSTPIPLAALAIWLLRSETWPSDASVSSIAERFLRVFNISAKERQALFDEECPAWAKIDNVFTSSANELTVLSEMLSTRIVGGENSRPLRKVEYGEVSPQRIARLLLAGRGQVVLHGPPGTSKTFLAKQVVCELLKCEEEQLVTTFLDPSGEEAALISRADAAGGWTLVQFHPSYCYEDFVRGLTPSTSGEDGPQFKVVDRTFAKLCRVAGKVDGPIVLIIDEMNRGDLSRILGELMYGLEYRGEPVATQYATADGASLVVPTNLYVIATLNSADKSISHLDFALRRRFDFVQCNPDRTVVEAYHSDPILRKRACALFELANSAIRDGRDYGVGHSYFLYSTPDGLASAFAFQVAPLLHEYRAEDLLQTDRLLLNVGGAESIDVLSGSPFHLHSALVDWMLPCSPSEDQSP